MTSPLLGGTTATTTAVAVTSTKLAHGNSCVGLARAPGQAPTVNLTPGVTSATMASVQNVRRIGVSAFPATPVLVTGSSAVLLAEKLIASPTTLTAMRAGMVTARTSAAAAASEMVIAAGGTTLEDAPAGIAAGETRAWHEH